MNVVRMMEAPAPATFKDAPVKPAEGGDFLGQLDQAIKDATNDIVQNAINEGKSKGQTEDGSQSAEKADGENMVLDEGTEQPKVEEPQAEVVVPPVFIKPENEIQTPMPEATQPQVEVAIATDEVQQQPEAKEQATAPTIDAPAKPAVEQKPEAAPKQAVATVQIEGREQQPEFDKMVEQTLKEADAMLKQQEQAGSQSVVVEQETEQPVKMQTGEQVQVKNQDVDTQKQVDTGKQQQTAAISQTDAEPKVVPQENADEAEHSGKKDTNSETLLQPMTANITDDGKVDFKQTVQQPAAAEQQATVKESVMGQIVDKVWTSASDEKTEFVLQLKPAHLGGLEIQLIADEKGIMAKLVTGSKDVQAMIQNDMVAMQEALKEKGLNVVHMEVIYDQMNLTAGKGDTSEGQEFSHNNAHSSIHGRVQDVKADGTAVYYDDMTGYEVLAEQGGSVEFSA